MRIPRICPQILGRQEPHIKPDLEIEPAEYMEGRVVYKIELYDKLGECQKRLYWATSLAGIILAASVPFVINLGSSYQHLATFLSLVVTILVSTEKLFHFREHWRNYDAMAAFLRSEQLQFQTRTGEYKQENEEECEQEDQKRDEAFRRFVRRVEQAIDSERKDTIEMRTRETNAG